MKINIAMICDNNYVMVATVAITSIVLNKSKETDIDIYILCDKLNQENIKKLKMCETKGVNIIIKNVDSSKYIGLEKTNINVTCTALFKFNIPNILNDVDKVLYLDCDTIIKKDLQSFYNNNLKDNYAMVISNGIKYNKAPGGKKHTFFNEKSYFNSGVMLMNLYEMRKDNVPKKLIDYRMNEYNYYMDQDALNFIMKGKVIYSNILYNFMLHVISFRNVQFSLKEVAENYNMMEYESIDLLVEDSAIIHYTINKPWKYYDVPFAETWMKYYKKSPFKDVILKRDSYITYLYNYKSFVLGRKIARIIKKLHLYKSK